VLPTVQIVKTSLVRRIEQKSCRVLGSRVYPTLGWSVSTARVLGRTGEGEIAQARLGDFRLGVPRPVTSPPVARYLPYCIDRRSELLCLAELDAVDEEARPFLYMAQRDFAKRVALVPFRSLTRLQAPERLAGAKPVLVFSIGRCGSTLLSRLLDAATLKAYSEPDVFNQAAILGRPEGGGDERLRDLALSFALSRFEDHAQGRRVAFKFRSQSLRFFHDLDSAFPRARHVFVLRGVAEWTRSWISAFGRHDDEMLQRLHAVVEALEGAQRDGRKPGVLWYEDIARDPIAACAEVLGEAPPALALAAIRAAAASDSQAGTRLSVESRRTANRDGGAALAADTRAFLDAWHAVQPRARLEALGLEGLIA
jgi:hypothetical protein